MFRRLQDARQSVEAKSDQAAAMCILPIFEFTPTGKLSNPIKGATDGLATYQAILDRKRNTRPVIDKFSELLLEFDKVAQFVQVSAKQPETAKLATAVVQNIGGNDEANKYLTSCLVIEQYPYLSRFLSATRSRELVGKLIRDDNLLSSLETSTFSLERAGLYLLAR